MLTNKHWPLKVNCHLSKFLRYYCSHSHMK